MMVDLYVKERERERERVIVRDTTLISLLVKCSSVVLTCTAYFRQQSERSAKIFPVTAMKVPTGFSEVEVSTETNLTLPAASNCSFLDEIIYRLLEHQALRLYPCLLYYGIGIQCTDKK